MVLYNIIPRRRNNGLKVRRLFDEPLELMGNRMSSFFDDFFEGFGTKLEAFSPSVDIIENEKEFSVALELPGVSEKDIHLTLEKDSLTIEGEKKEEHEEKEKGYSHIERSYGSFRRVIPLSAEVDESKVKAVFKKGVLTIKLPKSKEAKKVTAEIPIESN